MLIPRSSLGGHSAEAKRLVGKEKNGGFADRGTPVESIPGSVLLSHAASHAVPSPLEGLTAVFEMGTGVAPPP